MLKKGNLETTNFGVMSKVEKCTLPTNQSIVQNHAQTTKIIYVVNGKYSYTDSLGNEFELGRGETQVIEAKVDFEYTIANKGDKQLSYIKFEIETDQIEEVNIEASKYKWKLRMNQWLEIVSDKDGEAKITTNADVNVHTLMLDSGLTEGFAVDGDRMAYLIQIEGSSQINGNQLDAGDSLEIIAEDITLTAIENSHLIIIEMSK